MVRIATATISAGGHSQEAFAETGVGHRIIVEERVRVES